MSFLTVDRAYGKNDFAEAYGLYDHPSRWPGHRERVRVEDKCGPGLLYHTGMHVPGVPCVETEGEIMEVAVENDFLLQLRVALKRRGITHDAIAETFGMSLSSYRERIYNRRSMAHDNFTDLCQMAGLVPSEEDFTFVAAGRRDRYALHGDQKAHVKELLAARGRTYTDLQKALRSTYHRMNLRLQKSSPMSQEQKQIIMDMTGLGEASFRKVLSTHGGARAKDGEELVEWRAEYGEMIQEAIKAKGLGIVEVRKALGLSRSYLSNLLYSRRKTAKKDRLMMVCNYLGIKID